MGKALLWISDISLQPSPYLYLCHSYCLVSLKDKIYIKSSRVNSNVFEDFLKRYHNLLTKYENCLRADLFIWNMSCDLTKEQIIRYLMTLKIMVPRRNLQKKLLATPRLLWNAETKIKKNKIKYIYNILICNSLCSQ